MSVASGSCLVLVIFALVSSTCLGARVRQDERQVQERITDQANADQIPLLPGFVGPLKSRHYAGYVNVDAKNDRNLFYYFVESERDPVRDPVVLWMNGGPGCSSMDGFIYEQGPFNFKLSNSAGQSKVELQENVHAWSKVANMIFLESPAGVGLSYSRRKEDYHTNDTQTARDADKFLRGWFERFPHFKTNDFYISGESYAGIYVPNLARAVLYGNKQGTGPHINLKGYLVGNGVTDPTFDASCLPSFAVGKSLIGVDTARDLSDACGGVYWPREPGSACDVLYFSFLNSLSNLNVYDVLQDCYHDQPSPSSTTATAQQEGAQQPQHDVMTAAAALEAMGGRPRWPLLGGAVESQQVVYNWAHVGAMKKLRINPPCTDTRVAHQWLNDPVVRAALHAPPAASIGVWEICSDVITYTHDAGSMFGVHRDLVKQHGLRALIYSGDHDMAVPHTGSEAWTRALGLKVLAPWQAWYFADQQVGGYVVEYEGLTYATVKGAGHMVPQTSPAQALAMFSRFIEGVPQATSSA